MVSLSQILSAIPSAVQEKVDAEIDEQEGNAFARSALYTMSAWAEACKVAGNYTGTLAGATLFVPTFPSQIGYRLLRQKLSVKN